MKNRKRANRRAQTLRYQNRQVNRWLFIEPRLYRYHTYYSSVPPNLNGHFRRHAAFDCSCQMCCNDRHCEWLCAPERLTMAERRHLDSFIDQCKDSEIPHDVMKT